jgi:hypothetical protein
MKFVWRFHIVGRAAWLAPAAAVASFALGATFCIALGVLVIGEATRQIVLAQ